MLHLIFTILSTAFAGVVMIYFTPEPKWAYPMGAGALFILFDFWARNIYGKSLLDLLVEAL